VLQLNSQIGSQHHCGVVLGICQTPNQRVSQLSDSGHVVWMLSERVGKNIERLRLAKGWSRPELAKRLQPITSGQQIERLEKNQRGLTVEWIERVSRALGVDPAELIAGEDHQFTLTPQVADEVAEHLARVVLQGDEPDPAIVQDLSLILRELSATFSRHPEARRDPAVARPVVDFLTRQRVRP
jgi:transcriptional regulator with XRE-family HTH domain